MRRVRYERNGGPEVLLVEEVPVPRPGPGELLVRVEAVGVTLPVVRKVREAAEPVPLGGEVAGAVAALGDGAAAAGFAEGDRVTGLCFGHGYADYALLDTAMASHIPASAPAADAVALVRSGLVALGALHAARPAPGESLLATAAAGGVGHLAVQLARAHGLGRVVAAVGDPAKAEFVRGLGADAVVHYHPPATAEAAEDGPGAADPRGGADWGEPVDIALDGVGGRLLTPLLGALAPGGRLVAYSSGGGTLRAYDLLAGGKSAIGFQIARIARGEPARYAAWREELWHRYATGGLRPAVHRRIPLDEAARAHAEMEARANLGKIVLVP